MYKKSTSAPRGEKSFSRERKSSDKPKFSKDKPSFSKDKPKFDKEKPRFGKDKPFSERGERKPYKKRDDGKPFSERSERKPFSRRDDDKPFAERGERKPYKKRDDSKPFSERGERKPFSRRDDDKPFAERGERKPYKKRDDDKPFSERGERKPYKKRDDDNSFDRKSDRFEKRDDKKPYRSKSHLEHIQKADVPEKTSTRKRTLIGIRLNKYIANAGICSRREADTLIESGVVRINGVICTELGIRVMPEDKVEFGGETLISEKKVYLLMNKPKGYITTTDDPQERKTVMHLIDGACKERIYPVGRLDRQTTGVLLFTNDGEMAKKLTHPSHGARKIYHVTLDKNITKRDLQDIAKGVELEDGFVHVDEINLIQGTKNEIGIQLHSGMNRVVRRIFEKFDYEVVKLDRVLFAELTKKDLSRGHWRFLTDKEISFLKMK